MKPWYRKSDGWWYIYDTRNGKRRQVKLVKGKDNKEAAYDRWHELSLQPEIKVSTLSVKSLIDTYLDHVQEEKAPTTYDRCLYYLQSFCDHIGDVFAIQPRHVSSWIREKAWSDSTKAGAVQIVRTCFRWLTREGYIQRNPVAHAKAPQKKSREVILSEETYKLILKHSRRDFADLITFLWHTGCRPQEACNAEVRHVDLTNRRIVFPASEGKGRRIRVIYLDDTAFQLVADRAARPPHVRLFKTASGSGWDRNKIRLRFRRLKDKVGGSYCAYHIRHTFATNALQRLDVATVASLMGHMDGGATLMKNYQHLAKLPTHMIQAAQKAVS